MNTLTEHGIHWMHLNNGRSAGNAAYARKGTTSRVVVARGPKVSFDQTAAPVPEIMDDFILPKMVRLPWLTVSVVNS
jgi:hypothetical protein